MNYLHSKLYAENGFTLVEVLTTLLILTGIFFLLLPLGKSFFAKNLVEERVNTIVRAVKFAQNKAQLEGKDLVLAELSDELGWAKGMILFIDNTGNYHFEKEDTKIKEWHWRDSALKVYWHGFRSDHYLLFNPELKNSSLNGYFALVENEHVKRKILINRLGRVRVEK